MHQHLFLWTRAYMSSSFQLYPVRSQCQSQQIAKRKQVPTRKRRSYSLFDAILNGQQYSIDVRLNAPSYIIHFLPTSDLSSATEPASTTAAEHSPSNAQSLEPMPAFTHRLHLLRNSSFSRHSDNQDIVWEWNQVKGESRGYSERKCTQFSWVGRDDFERSE